MFNRVKLHTVRQLRGHLDQVANHLLSQGAAKHVRGVVATSFMEKKRNFSGDAYVQQIEKNAIYLREGTQALILAMVKFMWKGEPRLRPQKVADFVNATRIIAAQQSMPYHLAYLQKGCVTCPVHDEHRFYQGWRNMRLAGDRSAYLNEMEFSYKFYQATYVVAQLFLDTLLRNRQYAKAAKEMSPSELFESIEERVELWSNIMTGNVTFDLS